MDFTAMPNNLAERIVDYKRSHPRTNADRIRAMTDEELAEFLDTRECPTERCPNEGEDGCIVPTASCRECWLDWLRQEVAP